MSAHVETMHHAVCFDCGWEEEHRWSDEARDAADRHICPQESEGQES